MNRKLLSGFLFLLSFLLYGQETISYKGSRNYILKERTDLRRYDNGKYVGLVSKEVSSYISPVLNQNGYLYDGIFYILQDTKRASVSVTNTINDAISSVFTIDTEGNISMIEDNGFPTFRSFPVFPKEKVSIGDSWTGTGQRTIDPQNKGIYTKLPITVKYTYTGNSVFHNEDVYVIEAQWATRYGIGTGAYYIDPTGDSSLKKASGSHKANIYVSKENGNALLIKDLVDEIFEYVDGKQIALKGTIQLFTEYPPSVQEENLLPAIKRLAKIDNSDSEKIKTEIENNNHKKTTEIENQFNKNDSDSVLSALLIDTINQKDNSLKIEKTSAGLKFIIEDLKFKANSSELLDGEEKRLNDIAEVLKQAEKSQFLIEGHTASVGNPKGEYELSVERSHTIADQLIKRGIESSRLICKGYGGTKPIGDNNTNEGRAKNRRVEITILE